jgi:pyruvate formate lyase activating enzyme
MHLTLVPICGSLNAVKSGIIFDIKRFSVHDGPGIRTTVFLKGCPLKCPWCHNPEGISPHPEVIRTERFMDGKKFYRKTIVGREISTSELMDEIKKDRIVMEESGGGVTFSGGEPLLQHEFLGDMLILCKEKGIHTTVDTSGYAADSIFKKIVPLTDLFLFDLKCLNPDLHASAIGVPLQRILDNLRQIVDQGAKLRLRIPVIPGFNFDTESLAQYYDFMATYKKGIDGVHLLPFHAIANHKYIKVGKKNEFENVRSLQSKEISEWVSTISKLGVPVKSEA